MAERQGERQLWTLWISGEVDQIFIVSVSKVCKSRQDPVQLALIFLTKIVYNMYSNLNFFCA